MEILKSEYIFSNGKILKDYLVVIDKNTVIDVDKSNLILKSYNNIKIRDLGYGVLFGGFINLHTHTELSYMKNKLPRKKGFVGWIEAMIKSKKTEEDKNTIIASAQKGIKDMASYGTVAIGDISNTLISCELLKNTMPLSVVFFENYALNKERACLVKKELQDTLIKLENGCKPIKMTPTAHSVYSTNGCLIEFLANKQPNNPFSIHFLESEYEKPFINSQGKLFELLDGYGLVDTKLNYKDIFDYLKDINAYRKKTIFVHCVEANNSDLEKIKEIDSTVCLCPRSNKFISDTLPNIYAIEKSGVNIGVGTDSLASNDDLNVLNEIRYIYKHFNIKPQKLFRWITDNPAKALNLNLGLQKNKAAYGVFFATNTPQPLEEILENQLKPLTFKVQ